MISLTTPSFDLDGALTLFPLSGSELEVLSRRTSRVATLDAGVSLEDRGFAEGDRTFTVTVAATVALRDELRRLIRTYAELILTTEEGVFRVSPSNFNLAREQFVLTFEVKERLDNG